MDKKLPTLICWQKNLRWVVNVGSVKVLPMRKPMGLDRYRTLLEALSSVDLDHALTKLTNPATAGKWGFAPVRIKARGL